VPALAAVHSSRSKAQREGEAAEQGKAWEGGEYAGVVGGAQESGAAAPPSSLAQLLCVSYVYAS